MRGGLKTGALTHRADRGSLQPQVSQERLLVAAGLTGAAACEPCASVLQRRRLTTVVRFLYCVLLSVFSPSCSAHVATTYCQRLCPVLSVAYAYHLFDGFVYALLYCLLPYCVLFAHAAGVMLGT